ncbi:MAG: nitroreductase family protein [Planctomycetota bacterium]
MPESETVPLTDYHALPVDEMRRRAAAFRELMRRRRSVREFADTAAPREVIEQCLLAAGTAPSGANQQPWRFVVVTDPAVKREIRVGAEKEEHEFYAHRATDAWLDALAPIGTDEHKPFLETAPCLIVIFLEKFGIDGAGEKSQNYYPVESVGIATGMLITALHHAGLATLTHTPSPMGFLNQILGRPSNERPFLILVTGYPADGVRVPKIGKKTLDEIATFV